MKLDHPFAIPVHRGLLAVLLAFGSLASAGLAAAQTTDTAVYRVRFQANWSANTHPQSFPSNPHFSPLIGGVHSDAVTFWEPGGLASPGIEDMAERGRTTPLDQEVQAAIDALTAFQIIQGGGVGTSPGSASATFTAHRNYPLVSLVSMVAPSPDWFVGVSGLSMVQSGEWLSQQVVTLYGWDAGTDSGTTYTSGTADTNPPEAISDLRSSGPLGNGVPLGTFTFTRQDTPDPTPLVLRGGRFEITATWQNSEGTAGQAMPQALTSDTGYFWFFDQANVEAVVKVLDGCAINGHFWIFAGGLTDVGVEMVVTDTQAGTSKTYSNPVGIPFQPTQDTSAFATCP